MTSVALTPDREVCRGGQKGTRRQVGAGSVQGIIVQDKDRLSRWLPERWEGGLCSVHPSGTPPSQGATASLRWAKDQSCTLSPDVQRRRQSAKVRSKQLGGGGGCSAGLRSASPSLQRTKRPQFPSSSSSSSSVSAQD